ncbi:tagaturonate reductase [Oleiharenicola sp. Vm1]|uniref:tagaturonate reductase n=1 Tax=Oleiharenicola sp. Vm1 TaxID=3398393 RepID=UPI0039F5C34C
MTTLTRSLLTKTSALPAGVACGPLATFPERIVQFGEGNFLRAFADWMIDELNGRGLLQSQVLVVQPIRQGLAAQLNAQDGLYTVLVRGTENGQVVESPRVVTAVRRALDPYASWAELVATFEGNDLRFVLSNTTEAGIAYSAEAFDPARCPESFPAKIATLLYARFRAVRGHPERGLVFVPCELIERNGTQLRECVLRHAQAWGLPAEFTQWLGEANVFLNTLVDRIVPGYPKAEADALAAKLSYRDNLLVASEHFHLWVIEGPRELEAELPFARAGLNVVWTDDLTPYRSRKVRVLNGAHTGSVLAAFVAGATTVKEMMDDELTAAFVYRLVFDEIVPCLAQPAEERRAYAEAVLERFRNPFVRHELLSISLNSVSKWKVRVLPSLLDAVVAKRSVPPLLSFSLAALLWFYRGHREPDGRVLGRRGDERYPIRDDEAVLDFFVREWALVEETGDRFEFTKNALAQTQFWGRDLNQVPGLTFSVAVSLERIASLGMRETLKKLVVDTPRS